MKKGARIFWGIIVLLVVLGLGVAIYARMAPGKYDLLAQCIKEQGVKFYGAYWCPHCQATKAEFGNSSHLLPYVECATPGGQGQTQECTNAGIVEYPTWVRPDGARLTGEHTLAEWAAFSGCTIDGKPTTPQDVSGMAVGTSSAAH